MRNTLWVLLVVGGLIACQPVPTPVSEATPVPVSPEPLMVWVDEAIPLDQFWPEAAFSVHFSRPMDPESAKPALLFVPELHGDLAWGDDNTRLSFTPEKGFNSGQTYVVALNKNLRTAQGAILNQALNWEISVLVEKPASVLPPRVVRRSPSQKTLGERTPTLRLTFSREMDTERVAAALRVEPTVPVDLSWDKQDLIIKFRQPLTPGRSYRFTLDKSATAQDGVPLEEDYAWTHDIRDTLASTSWPTLKNRANQIVLRFSYTLDKTSLETSIQFEPLLRGNWRWDKSGTVATFTPSEALPTGARYTIKFTSSLLDATGYELPAPEPIHFTTPPPIVSLYPGSGETVNPATAIGLTFDRAVDEQKTAAAFHLQPETPGELSWQGNRLTFTPTEGYLQASTTYTVILDSSLVDRSGNSLLQDSFSWTFRTGPYTAVASFGDYGANAQVLDAGGRRAVQYMLLGQGTRTIAFELFGLTLEQFLDRYASGFRGVEGWEKRPISTEGAQLVRTWQETFSSRGTDNVQETILPQDVQPGLYILNLKSRQVDDQLILVLSRNTLVVKQAGGEVLAWASDTNGEVLSEAEVSVYARNGELISRGRTDSQGIYRTMVSRDPQPLIVVARQGEDFTASGLSNEWQSPSGLWWGWWQPAPEARDHAAYVYTERPIYQPGQQVHFKAVVRYDTDALITLPEDELPITARIRDARNNVVQSFDLSTNRFGTVNASFQLTEGAMLGDYAVEIDLQGEVYKQTFKVQDYRKPDIQVDVTSDAEQYVAGDEITVSVDTRYVFGEPVSSASLVIRYYTLGEPYYWYEPGQANITWYKSEKADRTAKTDENGQYTFSLPAEMSATYDNYDSWYYWGSSLKQTTWGIEVTVDDGSNQSVSGFAVVKVFNAAERLRLDTGGYAKTPGEGFSIRAQLTDIQNRPVANRDLTLTLRRWNEKNYDYIDTAHTVQLSTDAQGEASLPLSIREPGDYQLAVQGTDSQGNKLRYTTWLYVFSQAASWNSNRERGVIISADRDNYAPGDTAHLRIASLFSGPALLAFERGATRDERIIHLTAPLTEMEVPIKTEYAPNIYVTVSAWEAQDTHLSAETYTNLPDSQLRRGSLNLKVPVTDRQLKVSITPDKDVYAPREAATFTLRITDHLGKPVEAEVSLAMVDEAIYSLSEELSGPIFDAFYAERAHIVRTFDSMALRRYLLGYGQGGGGGDGTSAANPRREFPDTAAWFPTLHTDPNGEVVVTVTMPDTLTSWRLTARATTAETTLVGESRINVQTQQVVVVRPILPRTLTAGDQVMLSAMVSNFSSNPGAFAVAIRASGLEVRDPITKTVQLASGESRMVGWRASAWEDGNAVITVTGKPTSSTHIAGDAVELIIPVRPLAIPEVETQVGDFKGEFATTFFWPAQALEMSSVKVELNRSIAGSLLTGLEHLTGYPYGCVEQTMSKALPNAVVGRAFHQLGIGNPTLQAELPAQINIGLQKLYGFQHNDGGWGWWFDDSSDAYQTAWVVFGLTVTGEAGYEVDPQVIERGVNWLAERLGQLDVRIRAYALYSMAVAGHGDLHATQTLAGQVDTLDTFSQAAMALALHELGDHSGAGQILERITADAIIDKGRVYWQGRSEDGDYDNKVMASSTRTTAMVLSAFVQVRPGHDLEPGIVRWLMDQRGTFGWGSTNETAHAILALSDHLLASEAATEDTAYAVELNRQVISSGTLGRGEPAVSLEIPAGQLVAGDNSLRLRQSGTGGLYYTISQRVYVAEAQIEAAGEIQVSRIYLDPKSNRPVETISPGQLLRVKLTVRMPRNGAYMIIEDNLPGGLEALNERLNTTSHESSHDYEESFYHWQEYGYNNKEIRRDRVSFFSSEVSEGSHTYTYFARALYPGTFVAMPTEVSAMYDARLWGRSESEVIKVEEE